MRLELELTDANFRKEVLESNIPVLVDFWASWCPPCKMVEPVIKELASKYAGKVKVGKINVDRNPITVSRYDIKGVPTFMLFKEGKVIQRQTGAQSMEQLEEILSVLLRN
jgi:thioredoxin 1